MLRKAFPRPCRNRQEKAVTCGALSPSTRCMTFLQRVQHKWNVCLTTVSDQRFLLQNCHLLLCMVRHKTKGGMHGDANTFFVTCASNATSCSFLSLACLCGIPSSWVLGQSGDRDFLQFMHAVAIPWCSAMFRSKIMCQETMHVSPHAQGHTQRRAESDHITRLNNCQLDICFVLSTGCWQCSFCPWQVLPARQHARA